MNDDFKKPKRHPKNVPGPFFVEDEMCMTCGMPELEAPDLIAGTEDGHCYFKKQPSTPGELRQAINAVWVSCCGAVRYGGDDLMIIGEIAGAGGGTGS